MLLVKLSINSRGRQWCLREIHADVCCGLSIAHVEAVHLAKDAAVHLILLLEVLLLKLVGLQQGAQVVLARALCLLLVHDLAQERRRTTLRIWLLVRHLLALLLHCQFLEELLFWRDRKAQALILVVVENEVAIRRSLLNHQHGILSRNSLYLLVELQPILVDAKGAFGQIVR